MALMLHGLPVELLDRIADQFPEAEQDGCMRQHDAKSLWLVCRKTEMKDQNLVRKERPLVSHCLSFVQERSRILH